MRRGETTTSTTTTHQHRNKRQYQPSITSFFAAREDRDYSSESDEDLRGPGPINRPHARRSAQQQQQQQQQQQRDSLVPSVPGSVQADLLSVGMRVRKSVPEGYKTHKTASLPSIQTTLSASTMHKPPSASAASHHHDDHSVKPPRDPVPEPLQHQRELLPFCGLHKIGGYAEQPVTNVHLYGGVDGTGERPMNLFPLPAEAFNQPFSQSSSAASSISIESLPPNPTNPSKRPWHDEDEQPAAALKTDFYFKIPMKVSEDEVPVSPLSESPPPESINAFAQAALRPFAQPKTRRHGGGGRAMDIDGMVVKEGDIIEMDVENAEQTERRVLVGSSSDFGEADFLRPWSPGREVDMGGV
ncbi:hypothetical protein BU26DRAFT_182256 [Trematosphaeria pertusa]|uniref:Uncharacterized protein n=1 Tax=Trematosphaeria pertusa TaxID=390896 RepID=A0A6A6HT23_9PLEO|nr:uncharacterized protein BU26DRAFT_182256 [Trematosphaeria pertusa]KAF2241161.1 hypothetical protein BU26DRAFT_182256 [Trematosphaeria pertusa]